MGEKRKTYTVEFKQNAVKMYLDKGLGYKTVAKKLGMMHSMVRKWVKQYEIEGPTGLEEKRGKATGPRKGRPRTKNESSEEKIRRLEAENKFLKKLLEVRREGWNPNKKG